MTDSLKFEEAQTWIDRLVQAWEQKDPARAVELFKDCTNYNESPFAGNAADTTDGIKTLWDEVRAQSNIKVTTKIVSVSTNRLVAEYEAWFEIQNKSHHSSGIWIVDFENGKCKSFRQWFMSDLFN